MTNKTRKSKKIKSSASIPASFHERFDIRLGIDEARKQFLNRVNNRIFLNFFVAEIDKDTRNRTVLWQVANALGEEYEWYNSFDHYVKNDFYRCLRVIEASYNALRNKQQKEKLSFLINLVLEESEIDLGVNWRNGKFIRTGAGLLDQKLVNEPLRWLYQTQSTRMYMVLLLRGLLIFLRLKSVQNCYTMSSQICMNH